MLYEIRQRKKLPEKQCEFESESEEKTEWSSSLSLFTLTLFLCVGPAGLPSTRPGCLGLAQDKLLARHGYKTKSRTRRLFVLWAQLGSNQRPPDYESGALTS